MIEFNGFPARMRFTPIPNVVFSSVLPNITDITELKVLLHIFKIIYPKKGNLRFVSCNELESCPGLTDEIKGSVREALLKALGSLAEKGIVLHLALSGPGATEDIYFLNDEASKTVIGRIRNGELSLPGMKVEKLPQSNAEEPSDIFTIYEQNIGMLTPLIADELKEAGKCYPESWIKDAIREAVALNKRSWRYIARILEHWSTEGKDNGTYRGYSKKNADPDKYIRGKYGHMVQR